MGFVVLVVAAFCIGAAGVYGVQHLGLSAVKQSLQASSFGSLPVKTAMPVSPLKFDASKLRAFTAPKLDRKRRQEHPHRHVQPADRPAHPRRQHGAAAALHSERSGLPTPLTPTGVVHAVFC